MEILSDDFCAWLDDASRDLERDLERRRTWFDYTAYAALAILALLLVYGLMFKGLEDLKI